MIEYPMTLGEWKEYIEGLSGPPLRSKALAANQLAFVQLLQEEGFSAPDISGIYRAFARRFVADGQAPPGNIPGGYVNYARLAAEQ